MPERAPGVPSWRHRTGVRHESQTPVLPTDASASSAALTANGRSPHGAVRRSFAERRVRERTSRRFVRTPRPERPSIPPTVASIAEEPAVTVADAARRPARHARRPRRASTAASTPTQVAAPAPPGRRRLPAAAGGRRGPAGRLVGSAALVADTRPDRSRRRTCLRRRGRAAPLVADGASPSPGDSLWSIAEALPRRRVDHALRRRADRPQRRHASSTPASSSRLP